jgi:SAM-dependent methyltransferase
MVAREIEPLHLEYVSCELCGSDNTLHIFWGRDRQLNLEGLFRVVKCGHCGLIYINPRPTQVAILRYYPEGYRGFSRALSQNRVTERPRSILKRFSPLCSTTSWPPVVPRRTGCVLDVGCGEGRTLYRLKQLGWQAHGVELDRKAANYASETLGLNVFCGQLEEACFPAEYFDVVTLHHSLEHLPHPLASLREAHRILKEGGEVIIEVPNARSLQARLFRARWVYWDTPRHLYTFSDVTLQRMLIEAGFSRISLWHVPATGGFAASLQYVWNDLTKDPKGRRIWNSRTLRVGLLPLAFVIAKLRYADCIRAKATKD